MRSRPALILILSWSSWHSSWIPYLDNLRVCLTDATCYEIHMRFPTDMTLLWYSLEGLFSSMSLHCWELGVKRPRNRYRIVAKSYLYYCLKITTTASSTRMLNRRRIKLLEKLLTQRDRIPTEYGALLQYTLDYHKQSFRHQKGACPDTRDV